MKTAWMVGGVVVGAAGLLIVLGSASTAQQPRQPARVIEGQGGGGAGGGQQGGQQGVLFQGQATRRVDAAPQGEPQVDQQTGQIRIQRQTVNPGLRRLPNRPVANWRLGVDTVNAPKGLLISDVSRNSPAQRFGLETGDYLLDVMGYPVGFYQNGYYPLGDALNQLVRNDGWVNLLVWNKRTNGEEAMWIRLEPRQGQGQFPFRAQGQGPTNN